MNSEIVTRAMAEPYPPPAGPRRVRAGRSHELDGL